MIHEINYNSAPGFDPGDWVEFYNPHGYDLDVLNWVFKDEDDLHIFTFAEGTVIEPFGLIVVANDMFAFHNLFSGCCELYRAYGLRTERKW
ncbi:MAG: lamin tail domain-containing protein [Bacteroidales bacterium]|nr:lamin tail domain-containing protein [Bacteroidales bacterium]